MRCYSDVSMHLFVKLKYEKDIATLFVKFRTSLSSGVCSRAGQTMGGAKLGANTLNEPFIKCIGLSEGLDIFQIYTGACQSLLFIVRKTRIAICVIAKV